MCLRLPLISLQDIYWITEQDKNIKKIRISQNPLTFLERSRSCSFKEGPVKSLIVFIQAYIFPISIGVILMVSGINGAQWFVQKYSIIEIH